MHLRRQLVIPLCNHKDFFYPIMVKSIKGTYGFPRIPEEDYEDLYNRDLLTDQQVQEHNCPGPFSFLGYLRALLEPNFLGDELCLCLLSMAFKIEITVVNAEGFSCIRFRHKQTIPNSVVILCHCKRQNYVPARKSFSPCFAIRWVATVLGQLLLLSSGCPVKTSKSNWMVISALRWLQLQSDGSLLQSEGSESLISILYYFSQTC